MESVLEDTQLTRGRERLTYACKSCRDREVRCDDQLPKCSNCTRDGGACITFDPRFASDNSLLMITQWLDLAFARLKTDERLSSHASSRHTSLRYSATPSATIRDLLDSIDHAK
jgi:hypothetical protein